MDDEDSLIEQSRSEWERENAQRLKHCQKHDFKWTFGASTVGHYWQCSQCHGIVDGKYKDCYDLGFQHGQQHQHALTAQGALETLAFRQCEVCRQGALHPPKDEKGFWLRAVRSPVLHYCEAEKTWELLAEIMPEIETLKRLRR